MTEATTYSCELRDLAVMLVKRYGIHEGWWLLGFGLSMHPTNFGTDPDNCKPTGIVQIQKANLTLWKGNDEHRPSYCVNAAEVNPPGGLTFVKGEGWPDTPARVN
jgi:hypothetical protein